MLDKFNIFTVTYLQTCLLTFTKATVLIQYKVYNLIKKISVACKAIDNVFKLTAYVTFGTNIPFYLKQEIQFTRECNVIGSCIGEFATVYEMLAR